MTRTLAVLVSLGIGLGTAVMTSAPRTMPQAPPRIVETGAVGMGTVAWKHAEDFSAAVLVEGALLIGTDEGFRLQVGKGEGGNGAAGSGGFARVGELSLLKPGDSPTDADGDEIELDVEGLAAAGRTVYAIGSHSATRARGDRPDKSYKKNHATVEQGSGQPSAFRDRVYRFTFDPVSHTASSLAIVSLRPAIDALPVLKPFGALASKENGIDIEGLAVDGTTLYAGFRGPVLRHGFAAVLRFTFDAPATSELLFVPLDGRGVRDIVKTSDGFLVLAGPVGDGDAPHRLYWWNGQDCIPGSGGKGGRLALLGDVPPPAAMPGAKAEGMLLTGETSTEYAVVLLYDGAKNGAPTRFTVARGHGVDTAATALCGASQ